MTCAKTRIIELFLPTTSAFFEPGKIAPCQLHDIERFHRSAEEIRENLASFICPFATGSMNNEEVAGWRRNAALASLLVLTLQGFAARIIRYGEGGGLLDDAALNAIKDGCIRNLKNMEATGLPIETEADVFREAIAHLEQIMDRAIAEARQADND